MGRGTRVVYIGETYKVRLKKGKEYTVFEEENGWIQVMSELDELGFFPSDEFKLVV